MRRVGSLKEDFLSFANLYHAYRKAFRATKSEEASAFSFHLEEELFTLQKELDLEQYQPGAYRVFKIYEPKERLIAAAPFRDRVVHHALINVLEPVYEKRFISDTYATRKAKGTHRAIKSAQNYLRRYHHYLKMDIRKYFPSIDHGILCAIIERTIKDPFILRLCRRIIALGGEAEGLPIGNLTSQFFANVYLDPFDHYVKENLRIKGFVRYMDDLVFFARDRESLYALRGETEGYLFDRLALRVKPEATMINTALHGLPFLGVRIFPSLIRIRRENFKRSFRKLKEKEYLFRKERIGAEEYSAAMNSLTAYLNYWGNHLLKAQLG